MYSNLSVNIQEIAFWEFTRFMETCTAANEGQLHLTWLWQIIHMVTFAWLEGLPAAINKDLINPDLDLTKFTSTL